MTKVKPFLKAYASPISLLVSGLSSSISISIAMHWLPRMPHLEMTRVQAFLFVWIVGFLTAFCLSFWFLKKEEQLLAKYIHEGCPSNLESFKVLMSQMRDNGES